MKRLEAIELPAEEIAHQKALMREFASLEQRPRTYCVVTYGCQMNAHDSEKLEGMLAEMGMQPAESRETADFVIFNTCCVRDNAQRRALGNVVWLKELKKTRPELMVAVCGCMMQQKGMGEQILRQYPFVDLAFGTHNLYRFAQLMLQAVKSHRRVVEVIQEDEGSIPEDLPVRRSSPYHAYITIMYGCNNFCSYCIVPYVRGRERSRASARIIEEARQLKADGVKEIMLLGQNVNSYGLDVEGELSFAQLLAKLDEIGIERIRFMTSHPKDISDELIDVIANSKHICHALHLPVQHGSTRVLESMNRRYSREKYLSRVEAIRARIPDMSLTTDLIVGYPGETEEEFEETCSLVNEVRYDSAFTFIYSPRIGTRAADMPDQIPENESSRRIQKLIAIQKENTRRNYAAYIGQVHSVLVDEASKRDEHQMAGKNEYNITVNFPGDQSLIGQIVRVKITSAGESTLRGELID
ncbi:MAG: tRNA (N6-isopentenyl adenosine(37)-C2)-methylthiotransferase MiaB [Clostridiales bacterium]|nr:tRNA (N6-isopentenyl adenosine(37)-C2)-methylthiotransferase MiaB [Clostridiales bacterium]